MTPSVPTSTNSPLSRRFARTRWLYQEQGRDIGPFRPDEIGELVASQTIDANTLVRETTSQQWKKLGSIPEFSAVLGEAEQTRAARAKEAAFEKKVTAARAKRRLPLVIGGVALLVAGSVGGFFAYERYKAGDVAPTSGYTTALLKPLALQPVPKRSYLNTSGPIAWAEEKVNLRKSTKDKANRRANRATNGAKSTKGPRYHRGADDLAPEASNNSVRDLSFEEEEDSVGRELDSGDVQVVRNTAVPRLVRCAQTLASAQPGWPGTSIRFRIKNTGSIGSVRIGANGRANASFVGCVKKALKGVKVEAFDGPGRTLTVPLKVGR